MTYYEVHKLSREGFSIRKISDMLGLNWRTVKRMLSIDDDRDYERYLQTFAQKDKLLEPYSDFVRSRLEQFRDTSAAQMHDWLKEHYPDFPNVSSRTVFNFVHWIRQQHNLYFSQHPFTAHTAIEAHEKAFAFIGGLPDTLVYDQDRVFMVDENKGDLLLTEAFRNYSSHRGFKLHFCRKADPQSKGKVENVSEVYQAKLPVQPYVPGYGVAQ